MHDKEKILQNSINLIKEHNLLFIEDVISFLPCSKASFYEWGYNVNDSVIDALNGNKTRTKIGLRSKWFDSNNATVQIALYKLIGNDEERKALSNREYTSEKESDKLNINIVKSYEPLMKKLTNEELETVSSIYKEAELR
jgi:hypothetical protein